MADESMDCGFNNQPVADSFISHVPAFKFQQIWVCNSSVVWPGPELANMRRCQDLVRKYILRSHSMIPNSYAIKPENLTSPLDQRNAKQYNFVKQERWINMITVPLKGKIMFKVIKKGSKVVRNIKIYLQCCDCRFCFAFSS